MEKNFKKHSQNFAIGVLGIVLSITLVGCTGANEGSSNIQILLPPHPSLSEKSLNHRPQSSDPSFCYMVNIVGPGIPGTDTACYPSSGVRSGFQAPSTVVTLEVDKGEGRSVELYGYMPRTGETCATAGLDLQSVPLNRLYRLARTEGVNMSESDVTVRLTYVFPGLYTHVGIQNAVSSSCYASLPPISVPDSSTEIVDTIRGTRFQITGQVNSGERPFNASGNRFKVTHEVIYVR